MSGLKIFDRALPPYTGSAPAGSAPTVPASFPAHRIRPASATAHATLAKTLAAYGRLDEAAASYRAASALRPQKASWRRALDRIVPDAQIASFLNGGSRPLRDTLKELSEQAISANGTIVAREEDSTSEAKATLDEAGEAPEGMEYELVSPGIYALTGETGRLRITYRSDAPLREWVGPGATILDGAVP